MHGKTVSKVLPGGLLFTRLRSTSCDKYMGSRTGKSFGCMKADAGVASSHDGDLSRLVWTLIPAHVGRSGAEDSDVQLECLVSNGRSKADLAVSLAPVLKALM